MNPQYPMYIISKGRYEYNLTANCFEAMHIPYYLVVEPIEYELYAKKINKKNILVLPDSNLGQGSIPARNYCWQHAIDYGFSKHWVVDDNIREFTRLNRNMGIRLTTGAGFRAMEDFSDRYENMALSGPQYIMFAIAKSTSKPYIANTRIYSCILINHTYLDSILPERWRGRYNEDTDLSLRALKAGAGTCLFNAFIQGKMRTMAMRGGNTDELYQDNGRLLMAESLVAQHPDVAKVGLRYGRPQHVVDYRKFKGNIWDKRANKIENKIDNYGMYVGHRDNRDNRMEI